MPGVARTAPPVTSSWTFRCTSRSYRWVGSVSASFAPVANAGQSELMTSRPGSVIG